MARRAWPVICAQPYAIPISQGNASARLATPWQRARNIVRTLHERARPAQPSAHRVSESQPWFGLRWPWKALSDRPKLPPDRQTAHGQPSFGLAGARFHPSGRSIVASKIYDIPSEAWIWPLPSVDLLRDSAAPDTVGSGKRLIGRRLPQFWPSTEYGNVRLGPEMVIPVGNDEVIYSVDQADLDGVGAFTYNKGPPPTHPSSAKLTKTSDVHKGVYALYRLNVTSGEERLLVSYNPGGASRPELSHDGRTLAFVRRVRDKQALVLL